MRETLENLSKEELIKIANNYNLYNSEKMNKKELVKAILRVNNIKDKKNKNEKDIILKNTLRHKLSITIFILFLLLLIVITIAEYFTKFYFGIFPHNSNSVFGLILSLGSLFWSFFVFSYWWKTKRINIFMMINLILSIGWFINFLIRYNNNIKINMNDNTKEFLIYKTMFYVWIGLSASISIAIVLLIAIKEILS